MKKILAAILFLVFVMGCAIIAPKTEKKDETFTKWTADGDSPRTAIKFSNGTIIVFQ